MDQLSFVSELFMKVLLNDKKQLYENMGVTNWQDVPRYGIRNNIIPGKSI
jgi:hypothetical protein